MKRFILIIFIFLNTALSQNPVYSDPPIATQNDSITIYFDATFGDQGLMDYPQTVYAHTGVLTDLSPGPSDWRYVKTDWNENKAVNTLISISENLWKLNIGYPRDYYGVPSSEEILKLTFVFRNSNGTVTGRGDGGADIFLDLYEPGISVVVIEPQIDNSFGDPLRSPVFAFPEDTIQIITTAVFLGTQLDSISLYIEGDYVYSVSTDTLVYQYIAADYGVGIKQISVISVDNSGIADTTVFDIVVNPHPENIALPSGITEGINYVNSETVTLALFAPFKEFVYVIGDFNDWKIDPTYYMNRDEANTDSTIWWLTINGLTSEEEYAFQYLVDGEIRISDPYTEKVLDPWNDMYISAETYPDLKLYPDGKTKEPVSVFQTSQQLFEWVYSDTFQRPPKEELIIYELLVRDFVEEHNYQALIDSLGYLQNLGINAIELMPFNEFEGNSSWGYNPSFYFAPDKYYGTEEDLKRLIDECHRRGIAVIMDIVLNHSFGQSPMVRLYSSDNGWPTDQNPWYNSDYDTVKSDYQARHPYNVGFDFNHESSVTKTFVDRVLKYWITEYNIDGFRFDLSKGFTQKNSSGNVLLWGKYDASRIAILKRMADKIWNVDSTAYVVLEHFADNNEEVELADYGMMLWGNLNYNYNDATMGWHDNGKSDFSWGYYVTRGWTKPNLITYMESHDEERMMYKNLKWGNSSGNYNIKYTATALNRIKLVAAFFLTIPGPKMIWQFGELGYDVSIEFDGRTEEKPIRWNYFNDPDRNKLYQTYAALIKLRKENEIFNSATTNVNLWLNDSNGRKRIRLSHPSMKVSIIGNFGVITQSINPQFYHTGTWYDYFSGDSIFVSATNDKIYLGPGEFHIYSDVRIDPPDIDDNSLIMPRSFVLHQNYPNPFNPMTRIDFSLSVKGNISLVIHDILGREVKTLVRGFREANDYSIIWNGDDKWGKPLASGVYLYTLNVTNNTDTKKLLLLK